MVESRYLGRGSRASKVRRIRDALRVRIFESANPHGGRLPTESELVRIFDVPRAFVREAQALLVQTGIVSRRRGIGTVATGWNPTIGIEKYYGMRGDDPGGPPRDEVSLEIIEWSEGEHGPELEGRLDQPGSDRSLYFEFLVWWHGVPIGFGAQHVRAPECLRLDRGRLSGDLFGGLAEAGVGAHRADYVFRAAIADQSDAELLGVSRGGPIMLSDGVLFNDAGERVAVFQTRTRAEFASIAASRAVRKPMRDLMSG